MPEKTRLRLTPEQVAYFKRKYPEMGIRQLMEAFRRKFGIQLEYLQTKWLGKYYCSGCERYAPNGMYSIKEASYLFGFKINTIHNLIYKKKIKGKKIGKLVYLDQDEIDKLHEMNQARVKFKTPWPAISCAQAAAMLDMRNNTLSKVLSEKKLDAIKHDGAWYVRKDHVLWARKKLLAGAVNIPWKNLRKELHGEVDHKAPWPAYTTKEATELLGLYSTSGLSKLANKGSVPAFKHNDTWYLPKVLIDTVAAMRQESGKRIFWESALNYLKENGHEF